jgi:hypothetical protein
MRQSKNKKNAKSKADKYFSKYIRLRDSDSNGLSKCITCGTFKSWKEMDCGHFQLRDREPTRYDERNANAQCKNCNRFRSGLQYEHGKAIDRKYGEGTADELAQKAKMNSFRKQHDYEWIAKEYKQKIEQL